MPTVKCDNCDHSVEVDDAAKRYRFPLFFVFLGTAVLAFQHVVSNQSLIITILGVQTAIVGLIWMVVVSFRQVRHTKKRVKSPYLAHSNKLMNDLAYIDRYVAFVDILGFKDLIDSSVANPPKKSLQEIIEALKFTPPAGQEKIILGRIGDISNSNHQMSSFSDNIFISTDPTEKGLMHIVHHVEQISFKLLKLGFLCRGGITKGLCYHHNNIVFGPAVIEAHKIEKEVSKYPRVVLSEKVLDDGRKALPPVDKIFSRFVRQDDDSKYFIHYLRQIRLISDSMNKGQPRDYINMLEAIRAKIEEDLLLATKNEKKEASENNLKVSKVEKIKWIKKYFQFATE